MKNFLNKTIFTVAAAVALTSTGCDKVKDFGDTDVDPTGTTVPVTAALFTRAVAEMGGKEGGLAISMYTRPGYYAQYFSETQYPGASLYDVPQLEFGQNYSGFLNDLQNIINQNTNDATKEAVTVSGSNANQISTARILKAYAFWTLTDRWGDIPYSEALSGNPLPKYDTQESIYADLLKELKEAVDGFDGGLGMKGDAIYNGNTAKWQKFGNSLRMQIALRMSKVYPNAGGLAATEFSAALNHPAGHIAVNSDNAKIDFPGGSYQNPWYSTYVASPRFDDAISSTIVDILNDFQDPRVQRYGTMDAGFPYGLDRAHAVLVPAGSFGFILDGVNMKEDEDVIIMNAATVLFARAEAAERGWTSENAANLYNQAVATSFAQWGFADASSYLLQNGVAYGATDHLKKIGLQKWLAIYPDGMQAWAEWRRTGFPELTPSEYALSASNGNIPRRFVYGTGEYGTNNENVKEAAARLSGGDDQNSRMWWDK